jgi:glycosyltransferase involved in cell wall biosynthesis
MAESPPLTNLCLLPALRGVDGPTSFQIKLKSQLNALGVQVHHNPLDPELQAILVVSGTRHLGDLLKARRRGVRIVQRLDGINYLHRIRPTGMRHYLRSEYSNLLLSGIRRHIAHYIVYQSAFTRAWWQRSYGSTRAADTIILNGVDLTAYSPVGEEKPPASSICVQVIEGHLKDGNELALYYALDFASELAKLAPLPLELRVIGDVPSGIQAIARQRIPSLRLSFEGVQPRESIPQFNRSAHLLYSAEFNAPCPNAVIESLACGLPVAGYQTGALPEIIQGDAGRLVPYGSDPWLLGKPDTIGLANAAMSILTEQPRFRQAARAQAESAFDVAQMAQRYLEILAG